MAIISVSIDIEYLHHCRKLFWTALLKYNIVFPNIETQMHISHVTGPSKIINQPNI